MKIITPILVLYFLVLFPAINLAFTGNLFIYEFWPILYFAFILVLAIALRRISPKQLGFNNRIMGSNSKSGLSFPNYKKIAQSHKIQYVKIQNSKNLRNKINKILSNNKAVICELMLNHDQEQMPKAINKRVGKKSIPTNLEDMYPFLSEDELSSNNYKN